MVERMRRTRYADDGAVLITSLVVGAVAMALTLVVVATAVYTQRASGVDRQQAASVSAAEAGVDSAYATIQNAGLNLPCSWPASGLAQVSSKPDTTTVQASILYSTASNPTPHCPLAAGEKPLSAVIMSSAETQVIAGGTTRGQRGMESAINLTPIYGNGFDSALFADGTITVDNQGSVNGNSGSDADVYTNTSFICANGTNRDIRGSVYSQGDVRFDDECNVDGDVWAKGKVVGTKNSPTSIAGNVRAADLLAPGGYSITLMPNTQVGKQLYAAATSSWSGCVTAGKCVNNADPGLPLQKPFPILRADPAALANWTGLGTDPATGDPQGGFTQRPYMGACSGIDEWLVTNAASWDGKSIVVTDCQVSFAQQTDLKLKGDLAIFARGGISAGQRTKISSLDSAVKNIYWMVPYENGTAPCTSPTVTSNQQLTIQAPVQMLMYSPCSISIAQNSNLYGQIYSGSNLDASNSFDLTFRKVPVFGIAVESKPTLSYRIDVIYKREQN